MGTLNWNEVLGWFPGWAWLIFILAAIAELLLCFRHPLRKLDRWLKGYISRQHMSFLALALVFLSFGVLGVGFSSVGFLYSLCSLLLTAVGFLFAIYGVTGALDRVSTIPDFLDRASTLLREEFDRGNGEAWIVSTYPLIGSITAYGSREYQAYHDVLTKLLSVGREPPGQLHFAVCNNEMSRKGLSFYKEHYAQSDGIDMNALIQKNEGMLDIIVALQMSSSKVELVPLNEFPDFQAILTRDEVLIFFELEAMGVSGKPSRAHKNAEILGWHLYRESMWADEIKAVFGHWKEEVKKVTE